MVSANEGRQLCTGRMAHDENAFRVTSVRTNVGMGPGERLGDIFDDALHFHLRKESIVRGNKDHAEVGEELGFELDTGLVTCLPAASMYPKNDGCIFSVGWNVDIENLTLMAIGDVSDLAVRGWNRRLILGSKGLVANPEKTQTKERCGEDAGPTFEADGDTRQCREHRMSPVGGRMDQEGKVHCNARLRGSLGFPSLGRGNRLFF